MIITRTPYRLSLYGGGLDYPEWYERSAAKILCAGLDYYCYQTVRRLPPFFNHKYRACYSKVETTNNINDIKHPAVREVIRKYGNDMSIETSHVGDLPSRSGIGSSSAFTVGLINSMNALQGRYLGKSKLAEAAINIEQKEMKEIVGIQDQCAAAFGGMVYIEADKQSIRPRKFVSRKEYLNYICENTLLGFDGNERFSGDSSIKIKKNIKERNKTSIMEELALLSEKGIEEFGNEADIKEHAELTKKIRDIKLILNGDICNRRTNEIIETTERAGSLCTRVMGAGGGGFFVCWAPRNKHDQIKNSINIRTWVEVRLSNSGSQVIFAE